MGLFALHDYKMTSSVTSGSSLAPAAAPRKRRTFDIAFLTGQSENSSEPPSAPVSGQSSSSISSSSNSSKRLLLSRDEDTNSSSNCSIDILTNGSSLSDSEERESVQSQSPVPIKVKGRREFSRPGYEEPELRYINPVPEPRKLNSQFSNQQHHPMTQRSSGSEGMSSRNSELTLPGPTFGFLPQMGKFPMPSMHFGPGKPGQGSPPSPADVMLSYATGNKVRRGCYPPDHYPPPGIHYPPFHPYHGLNISLMSPGQGTPVSSAGSGISAVTLLPPSLTSLTLPAQNVCAKCNIGFRMTSDLVYHMRSHHKRETDPLKKKREDKLKCPVCHETFRERHHLTRHMTAHQDRAEEAEEASKQIQIM